MARQTSGWLDDSGDFHLTERDARMADYKRSQHDAREQLYALAEPFYNGYANMEFGEIIAWLLANHKTISELCVILETSFVETTQLDTSPGLNPDSPLG